MKILGIETSCDETAAAIVEHQTNNITLLSNAISTSMQLHAKTGGIIPEQAARQQITYILPVIQKALTDANIQPDDLDAIAVTYGPGLIGSLLVGVETAKTLAYTWHKPLIPVNHLIGHIYANFITNQSIDYRLQTTAFSKNSLLAVDRRQWTVDQITFPALGVVVSGGHTDLVLLKNRGTLTWLGGTRDDAAGEAFDKIGRLLDLPYPAGPIIEQLAQEGDPKAYQFPRPLIGSHDFDFSFSGLKTAVLREIQQQKGHNQQLVIADICASAQQAIIDVLIRKTLKAAEIYQVKSILLGGGVAANQTLVNQLRQKTRDQRPETELFVPSKSLCTDNAAMIAAAACFNRKEVSWKDITADPELYFD